MSLEGLVRGSPRAVRHLGYALVVLVTMVFAFLAVRSAFRDGTIGFDFEGTLWDPAIAIREARSPYPAPLVSEVEVGNPALYPPLLIFTVVPLTLLALPAAMVVWLALSVAAIAATLYLLEVRDLRCYALALISTPAITGLIWGNATLLLLPLVALAWRYRRDELRSGVLVGLAIVSKLFLWPLIFWLLGTRRYKAAGAAFLATGLGTFAPWSVIGFDGLSAYRDLMTVAGEVYGVHSYSIATALSAMEVETTTAIDATLGLGLVIAALAFLVGRRGADEVSLSLAILAGIFGSPIVWEHYYALLLVPLAIARPRFSALWLLPLLFYVTHRLPRPRLLAGELEPGGVACCKPDGVPLSSWVFNHAPAGLWPALGHAALAVLLVGIAAWTVTRSKPTVMSARAPF